MSRDRLALIFVCVSVFLYLIVDSILTFTMVEYTVAYEFNPLVRKIIHMKHGYIFWLLFKIIPSTLLLYIMYDKPMFKTSIFILAVLSLTTLHNIRIIIKFI